MADTTDETPAQRQARIRRQKREAKITGSASERLDKITRLSGRTPESMRNEDPAITAPSPPRPPPSQSLPPSTRPGSTASPEQVRAQEEYLKALLRQPMPQDGQGQTQQQEDPMMQMLQAMMGSTEGSPDANGPGGGPGLGMSPDDIAKATGLPPFLTNMVMGQAKAPPSKAEIQAMRVWRVVHVVFAIMAGIYLVFRINRSTETFGEDPPAPATFQNPFVVFLTGEVLVQSARVATNGHSGKSGIGLGLQMAKEFIGDGAVVVFMLGIASWIKGSV